MRLLITGGTGSLGNKLTERLYSRYSNRIDRLIIYSRDEFKQFEMAKKFPIAKFPTIQFMIGDVRDSDRLKFAMRGIDTVIHTAALKQVPATEVNPFEAIKTNIIGAQNVIDAAIYNGVKKIVALSTDKAAAPINLYGATKLCSDKLFIGSNSSSLKISAVRYGNVMGSRGSVIPFFLDQRKTGSLSITDERMTRFNISLDEGVDLVFYAMEKMWGGEIFVPKIPSYRITDIAQAILPNSKYRVTGIRAGEKLHEEMITETDGLKTIEIDKYFVILSTQLQEKIDDYCREFNGKKCQFGFKYSSDTNKDFLTVDQIRQLIIKDIDPSFIF